ncbi:MAG: hypothetical protein ACE5KJ_01860 [Candidatus Zixiibacteriota bacterium]
MDPADFGLFGLLTSVSIHKDNYPQDPNSDKICSSPMDPGDKDVFLFLPLYSQDPDLDLKIQIWTIAYPQVI